VRPIPWFTPLGPPADLADLCSCSWIADVSGEHRLVPDGCVDVVWIDHGAILVCGHERRRPTIAALAADAGYADHAHLVRECRTIAGATPTELLDGYVPTFPNGPDPYKTVVPAWRDDRVS
jgi:AraC-like DNA-binding protein